MIELYSTGETHIRVDRLDATDWLGVKNPSGVEVAFSGDVVQMTIGEIQMHARVDKRFLDFLSKVARYAHDRETNAGEKRSMIYCESLYLDEFR